MSISSPWRLTRLMAVAALLFLVSTASAEATSFKGSSVSRERGRSSGDVALSLGDGKVTAFSAEFFPICEDDTSVGGEVHLDGGAATIAPDGSVTFPVTGELDGYGDTVTGSVTLKDAREGSAAITGLLTSSVHSRMFNCTMDRDLIVPANVYDRKPTHPQFGSLTMPTVSFDRVGSTLRKLYVATMFYCPGGGTIMWSAPARGIPEVKLAKDGTFSVSGYDTLESYGDGVSFTVQGRVTKHGASGTITIHAPSFEEHCGNVVVKWTSAPPAKPFVPGPDLSLNLYAVRRPTARGASYGIGSTGVTCTNGATHFRITVGRRSRTTSCAAAAGRVSFLIMGLKPGKTYSVGLRALKVRNGKVVRRGRNYPQTVHIALPSDPGWEPLPNAAA